MSANSVIAIVAGIMAILSAGVVKNVPEMAGSPLAYFLVAIVMFLYNYVCFWIYYKIWVWLKKQREKITPIVRTEVVDVKVKEKVKGRLVASIIGKELFGSIGEWLGAINGLETVEKVTVIFDVYYEDGSVRKLKAKYGSALFNKLSSYLD